MHALAWTHERIDQLGSAEVGQLRANAERLGESGIVSLCDAILRERPKGGEKRAGASPRRSKHQRHLISRGKAFEARGIYLQDARASWSGVRRSDGAVVIGLWAADVRSNGGGCSYLLWAPNVAGSHPWSDKPAGKERLEHCRAALERGAAEALLVYGERLEGYIPEDKARTVEGVDPETVVPCKVEKRGQEYWAIWGKKNP